MKKMKVKAGAVGSAVMSSAARTTTDAPAVISGTDDNRRTYVIKLITKKKSV